MTTIKLGVGDDAIEVGRTYFTAEGHKVSMLAHTTDGRMVVCALVEHDDYEGSYTGRGDVFFVDRLYVKAPRELVDAELVELKAEADKLREANHKALRRALDAEKEVTDRLAKLKKFKGLERLEDFIDGKFTHILVDEPGDYVVGPISLIDYVEDDGWRGRKPDGMKLLSLYGNTKGDITWHVNRYKDGSGNWQRVHPCTSEAEAIALRGQWIAEGLAYAEDTLITGAQRDGNSYLAWRAISIAHKHGVPIPPDLMKLWTANRRESLIKMRSDHERTAATYAAKAKEVADQLAALDGVAA